MNIFIVDDDINIIKIIEQIIDERKLAHLVGYANDGLEALRKIQIIKPDIILVDFLMPGKDGISLVNEVKTTYPEMQFIMLSQVSSKEIIAKAYEGGVEYYIQKPINAIEVENIIKNVIEKLEMKRTFSELQKLFNKQDIITTEKTEDYSQLIKRIMKRIGIMGEVGSQDIINILEFLLQSKKNMSSYTIKELCGYFTDNPKSMEQRIRRTAMIGMINLSNLGVEDYMNEIFMEYSTGLYTFEQVKKEMDYIRGKSKVGGTINLKKFIDGMLFYCES